MGKTTLNVAKTPQTTCFRVSFVKRWALVVVAFVFAAPAAAEHWMFQPSYYSHTIAPPNRPLPSSRSSYRVPSVSNNPGFSIRGEYRVNYLRFRNGNSTDLRIQYRGNVELDP